MKYLVFFLLLFVGDSMLSQKKIEEITSDNLSYRESLNQHYADSAHSPLTVEARKEFDSLPFFPVDTHYYVIAKFELVKNSMPFMMKTSTKRKPAYKLYAKAVFVLNDTTYTLNLYQNLGLIRNPNYRDYLFLPFNDYTNGNETYGGGRYLDLRIPKGDTIVIDFNKAYNPYCAYTDGYSCPVPPKENSLPTVIKAGVRYEDKEH